MEREVDRSKLIKGATGEDAACRLLVAKGYSILDRNYTERIGELDIVCRRDNTIVFVEVRSATTTYLTSPVLSIDARKQQHIVRTAQLYLMRHGLNNRTTRFDVIGVLLGGGELKTEWIQDAFRPESTARKGKFR